MSTRSLLKTGMFVAKHAALTRCAGTQAAAMLAARGRVEPPIKPRMWTGKSPVDESTFIIDCAPHNMAKVPQGNESVAKMMKSVLDERGLVLLRNTRLEGDLPKMGDWARFPMGKTTKYEGGANSRGEIAPNVFDVGAPKEAWLHYHHEMAYIGESVNMLGFCAQSVLAPEPDDPLRGATFLSENNGATEELLASDFGQKLKDKGICYIRCLTDGAEGDTNGTYNHWQTSFGVHTPEEVEKLAAKKGLQISWGPGRYLKTKYYTSAFEFFPKAGRNVLYSSIADHSSWFDAWPGVKELPEIEDFEDATPDQRPLKLTFGDDSEMSQEELVKYAEVYDNHGFPIRWQAGDIAVVCNYRFAHGRHPIHEKPDERRELGVVLGPTFRKMGDVAGKW